MKYACYDNGVKTRMSSDQALREEDEVRGWTTIRDVAKLAGVSFKTVSRVINNDPYVSNETLAKVKRVIEELGYRPNITARGLAVNRTFLIGLVIPEITSAAYAMMIHGVEEESVLAGLPAGAMQYPSQQEKGSFPL